MCGIVGVTGTGLQTGMIDDALAQLHHRGPDGRGVYLNPEQTLLLGHTRLAIIDPATGQQPLCSDNGDTVLACNGELYGFESLCDSLQARGHRFHTRSDSEVILALYREHGLSFFEHVRGEFAFLLYDRREHCLLAVRDRLGIKPLFYAKHDNGLVFASEAKALFATGLVQARFNIADIRDMQAAAWVDSVFDGVYAVPPAHYLRIDLSDHTVTCLPYWSLPLEAKPFEGSEAAAREQLFALLDDSVRLRLRADVPVGIALSGGLDSATVAALACRHAEQPLPAFSIAFPDTPPMDESQAAQETAAWLGMPHHVVRADEASLLARLETALWHSELPTQSLNGVGKLLLAECAATRVKVLLSGEGSDELFLGYPYFHAPGRQRQSHWQRGLFRREHRAQLATTAAGHRSCTAIEARPASHDPLLQKQYFSIRGRLLSYVLTLIGDRSEMAHSLEGRVPMLDHHLLAFTCRIPPAWKYRDHRDKAILRDTVRDIIPPAVYQRPKRGYRAPPLVLRKGRHATLDRLMQDYLSAACVREAGVYSPVTIRLLRCLRACLPDRLRLARRIDRQLFYVMSVHILYRQFIRPHTSPAP